jgi:hypothetical protein
MKVLSSSPPNPLVAIPLITFSHLLSPPILCPCPGVAYHGCWCLRGGAAPGRRPPEERTSVFPPPSKTHGAQTCTPTYIHAHVARAGTSETCLHGCILASKTPTRCHTAGRCTRPTKVKRATLTSMLLARAILHSWYLSHTRYLSFAWLALVSNSHLIELTGGNRDSPPSSSPGPCVARSLAETTPQPPIRL